MAEQPSEIEGRIESQRHDLGEHVQELEAKLQHVTDWRTYAPNGPGVLIIAGLSMAVGLLMILVKRAGRP